MCPSRLTMTQFCFWRSESLNKNEYVPAIQNVTENRTASQRKAQPKSDAGLEGSSHMPGSVQNTVVNAAVKTPGAIWLRAFYRSLLYLNAVTVNSAPGAFCGSEYRAFCRHGFICSNAIGAKASVIPMTFAKTTRHGQNFPTRQTRTSTIVSSASTEMNSNFP